MALPLLEIDSFLPVINQLSNVFYLADKSIVSWCHQENWRDDGLHISKHIRGVVSKADLDALHCYTRRVGTFILTDSSPDLKGRTIPHATFIRLAQLHSPPFFPALKHLRIVDVNASLTHLNLLLSNSLQSIEIYNIHHTQEEVFLSFLITLADECPELSSMKLASPVSTSVWENCLQFRHLHALELDNISTQLDFDLLLTIGKSFPQLEVFSLYARIAKYTRATNPSDTLLEGEDKIAEPQTRIGHGFTDAELSALHSDGRDHPGLGPVMPSLSRWNSSEPLFLRLERLHMIGSLDLILDLVESISSPCLKEIGLILVRSNRPKFLRDPRRIDLETPLFAICLEKILSTWGHGLVSVVIGQYEDYPPLDYGTPPPPVFPTLPIVLCQKLLFQPMLECLRVFGWTIESFLDYSLYSPPPTPASSSLTSLYLQVERINQAISLPDLQFIAKSFPNLVSLQSRIVMMDDSDIPVYGHSKAATFVLSHGLEQLSVGSACLPLSPKEVLDIARYIFGLFPNLEVIETHEGQNENQWNHIHSLIQAFQGVCLDHAARLI